MGSIIKKLRREPHTCNMCKKYKIGNRYTYKTFTFKKHPSSELIICEKCAKREHGPKNKTTLNEYLEGR